MFDVTYFGYGAGLVMAGWAVGMAVNFIFRAIGLISRI
jgi:hypothetical protein